jgi:hypothetical protein
LIYLITQFKIFLISIIFIFLGGCSTRDYSIHKEKYLVTIKSPELKYSDMGTISKSDEDVAIELFAFGNKILDLKIESLIYINGKILPPSIFYSKYLQTDYPEDTIKNIFMSKPIFNNINIVNLENQFTQEFDSIYYRVSSNETFFKDNNKNIIIKFVKQ